MTPSTTERPAWAQGPEWEKWLPSCDSVFCYGRSYEFSIAVDVSCFVMRVDNPNDSWTWKYHNSPDALRIYAEGLLRLEAELEASE